MAYSDYGGYVYRNRERVVERSDWAAGEDGANLGAPGAWPGFVAVIGKGMSPEDYARQAQGPAGHAVLGSGPIHVSLCKDYYVLVHHQRDQILYWTSPSGGPRSTGERQATILRLGGQKGPRLRIVTEEHPQTRSRVLYAELEENALDDGRDTVVWTGWSSSIAGAGWDAHHDEHNPEGAARTAACDARMRELLWDWTEPEHETIRWSEQCKACNGSGLYSGRHEATGIAVVCGECKGEGGSERSATYTPLVTRFPRRDIERVFECNPGVELTAESTGGVEADDWEDDPESTRQAGAEAREQVCPAWWYLWADHQRQPTWPECNSVQKFRDCPLFNEKAECWNRFDREAADAPNDGAGAEGDEGTNAPEIAMDRGSTRASRENEPDSDPERKGRIPDFPERCSV